MRLTQLLSTLLRAIEPCSCVPIPAITGYDALYVSERSLTPDQFGPTRVSFLLMNDDRLIHRSMHAA